MMNTKMEGSLKQGDEGQFNGVDGDKLKRDLDSVMEKAQLCQELLAQSPGIEQDELLSDIVGFLEACRDKLVLLIEAGSQGEISEELFEYSLKVNDAVMRTLEAEWNGTAVENDSEPSKDAEVSLLDMDDSPAVSNLKVASLNDDMSLLSMGYTSPVVAPTPAPVAADPFDPFGTQPPVPPTPVAPAAVPATKSDADVAVDDFDSFFESLQ